VDGKSSLLKRPQPGIGRRQKIGAKEFANVAGT
jgi:hypothetical protein